MVVQPQLCPGSFLLPGGHLDRGGVDPGLVAPANRCAGPSTRSGAAAVAAGTGQELSRDEMALGHTCVWRSCSKSVWAALPPAHATSGSAATSTAFSTRSSRCSRRSDHLSSGFAAQPGGLVGNRCRRAGQHHAATDFRRSRR
ncbi:hypothetical protein ACFQ0Q_08145 [Streptomyces aureus]